jgi:hypothetical protein
MQGDQRAKGLTASSKFIYQESFQGNQHSKAQQNYSQGEVQQGQISSLCFHLAPVSEIKPNA